MTAVVAGPEGPAYKCMVPVVGASFRVRHQTIQIRGGGSKGHDYEKPDPVVGASFRVRHQVLREEDHAKQRLPA